MMRKLPSAIAAAALVLGWFVAAPQPAVAQNAPSTSTAGATAFIQHLGAQTIDVLGPAVPAGERRATFRRLLSQDFDLADAGRFVLGPYGRALTPAQRQEFVALFRDALAKTYAERLEQYAGQQFRVTGARPLGGGAALVNSEIVRSSGQPVRIDWQVARHGGRFLVTDVSIDGVSEKLAQRNEIIGIIQRNGGRADAVIAALHQDLQGTPTVESGSSSPPKP